MVVIAETVAGVSSCSQLEEQRLFYERRLASANESESRQLVTALENDKKQLKKANETLAHKAHKLEDELTFVRYRMSGCKLCTIAC